MVHILCVNYFGVTFLVNTGGLLANTIWKILIIKITYGKKIQHLCFLNNSTFKDKILLLSVNLPKYSNLIVWFLLCNFSC